MDAYPSARQWLKWLERLEHYGYLTAGLSFLLLGMLVFFYAWISFVTLVGSGVWQAVLILTKDLLFVMILLELFRTVVNYLKSNTITIEPFLYIGIVAGIRRILTSGSQLIQPEDVKSDVFNMYIWDAGMNLAIVIILVAGLYVFRSGPSEAKPSRG